MMVSMMSWNVLFMVNFAVSTVMMVSMWVSLMCFVVKITSTTCWSRIDDGKNDQKSKSENCWNNFDVHFWWLVKVVVATVWNVFLLNQLLQVKVNSLTVDFYTQEKVKEKVKTKERKSKREKISLGGCV